MDQQPETGRQTALPGGAPGGVELSATSAEPVHAVVVGRVTQADGSPARHAPLTLTDLAGQQMDRAWADGAGRYRLIPPTSGTYLLVCAAGANTPAVALLTVAQTTVHHDIVLTGSGGLTGYVRAERTGNGLSGARVTLLDIAGNVVTTLTTDADGRYRVDGLAQDSYTLAVVAEHCRPKAVTVTIMASVQTEQDIHLAVCVRLEGTVRSASTGRPVEDALVTILGADGTVLDAVTTGQEGGYAFEELPEGTYTLTAAGYPPVAAQVHLAAGMAPSTDLSLRQPRDPAGVN